MTISKRRISTKPDAESRGDDYRRRALVAETGRSTPAVRRKTSSSSRTISPATPYGGTTTARCRRRSSTRCSPISFARQGQASLRAGSLRRRDHHFRVKTRVFTEYAWHSLFIRTLLIRPQAIELATSPELTIVDLPSSAPTRSVTAAAPKRSSPSTSPARSS